MNQGQRVRRPNRPSLDPALGVDFQRTLASSTARRKQLFRRRGPTLETARMGPGTLDSDSRTRCFPRPVVVLLIPLVATDRLWPDNLLLFGTMLISAVQLPRLFDANASVPRMTCVPGAFPVFLFVIALASLDRWRTAIANAVSFHVWVLVVVFWTGWVGSGRPSPAGSRPACRRPPSSGPVQAQSNVRLASPFRAWHPSLQSIRSARNDRTW